MDIKDIKPVSIPLRLRDGQKVGLTLNFLLLYKLRAQKPEQYKRFFTAYNDLCKKNADPVFFNLDIIYTGYLCDVLGRGEMLELALDFEAFLNLVPVDMDVINDLSLTLLFPKKAADFAARSETAAEQATGTA
ncbi:MAG: hypothetical protein IJD21_00330 [Oscillospiraceae bacterium]|nr:hypothetical protein [Oscillospiraceae bacterium]